MDDDGRQVTGAGRWTAERAPDAERAAGAERAPDAERAANAERPVDVELVANAERAPGAEPATGGQATAIATRAIERNRPNSDDRERQAVLRSFVRRGRVVSMPAGQSKRLVLLRWLRDECFAAGRVYPEREVNERLAAYHEDFAMLRRYMVDAGLLTRSDSGSEYRRGR